MSTGNMNDAKMRRNVSKTPQSASNVRTESRVDGNTTSPRSGCVPVVTSLLFCVVIVVVAAVGSLAYSRIYQYRPSDGGTVIDEIGDRETINVILRDLFMSFSPNVLEGGHVYFDVDGNITLMGSAIDETRLPVTVAVSVNHGSVYIYDRKEALLAIGVSAYTKEYDEFGKTTGQSFYYRQVTSDQDLAYICCLLNENAVRTVFSLTWVNATYDQGKPAGNFQCIVAFIDQRTTYVIRHYNSQIIDVNDGQFSMFDYVHSKSYDVDLKASDVMNSRIVNKISESHGKTLSREEVNNHCKV